MGPLRPTAFLAAAALAFPAVGLAATHHVLPPGNSGANQYTETLPGAGGNVPSGEAKGGGLPAKSLGSANAAQLEALGPEGRAAAQLAAATGPKTPGGSGSSGAAAQGGSGAANGRLPSGSAGLGQILGQLSGASASGGMGILLPLAIVAAAAGSFGYLWRKRRTE